MSPHRDSVRARYDSAAGGYARITLWVGRRLPGLHNRRAARIAVVLLALLEATQVALTIVIYFAEAFWIWYALLIIGVVVALLVGACTEFDVDLPDPALDEIQLLRKNTARAHAYRVLVYGGFLLGMAVFAVARLDENYRGAHGLAFGAGLSTLLQLGMYLPSQLAAWNFSFPADLPPDRHPTARHPTEQEKA